MASWREVSQRQAVLFGKLVAVADATPVAEFAPMEIAAALAWTRQAATTQLDLALDVVRRLPDVHAALARGDLDLPRARVIRDTVAVLELDLARRVTALILPEAPALTTGQLRARLGKLVIEADPAAAASRHKARVRQRRMVVQPTEDSCANVLGLDLPAASAMVAADRVAAIARAVKQAGDPRSLDQIRADTFLDLLLGNATADPARPKGGVELVANLETVAGLSDQPGHLNGYGAVIADIARQIAEQQRHMPWHFTIYDDATGDFYTGTTRVRPADKPSEPNQTASPARPHRDARGSADTSRPHRDARGSAGTSPPRGGARGSADTSRPRGDARGSAGTSPPHGGARGSSRSARSHRDAWESADAVRRDRGTGENDDPGDRKTKRRKASGDAAGSGVFGDPALRFPNAALARHIRARDRTCRAPGCRRPATRADLDHTIAYRQGGRTAPGNLGPLCRFHHRAKHQGGWRLYQIRPGIFIWQSPLGRLYLVMPEPP